MINCMIAGVGGQGTVLASKLIAGSAINCGLDVRTTETIGMAQRGGCVVSHIRIGENISSPLIPLRSADIIIAFEPAEAVRLLPYLADEGLVIACDSEIQPVTSSLASPLAGGTYQASVMINYLKASVKRLVIINGDQLLSLCGNAKTMNVALLGTAVKSGVFPFSADDMKETIKEMLAERFWEMNIKSFEIGRNMYYAV